MAEENESDRKAHERQELERKILAGLDSPVRQMTAADWQELRTTLSSRLGERRRTK